MLEVLSRELLENVLQMAPATSLYTAGCEEVDTMTFEFPSKSKSCPLRAASY